jgi:Domain of unknown function (DUF4145)
MEPIRAGTSGTCPHCLRAVHFVSATTHRSTGSAHQRIQEDAAWSPTEGVRIHYAVCPSCKGLAVSVEYLALDESSGHLVETGSEFMCLPLLGSSRPIPAEVPAAIAKDYRQAALVLNLAPEASAALSRRCLQAVLRDQGYNQHDLYQQIKAAKSGSNLPTYVAADLDHIREIGNFGAHPNKDTNTGEIIEVEQGEVDWNLHVLDLLFDHYYARPAKAKQMRDAAKAKTARK